MAWKSLSDVYNIAVRQGARERLNEDVRIDFTHDDGKVFNYRLEDAYAHTLRRQIVLDTSDSFTSTIHSIFDQGGWGTAQPIAAESLRRIAIASSYDRGLDLLEYLKDNKSELLSLNSLEAGKVFNFYGKILESIPDEFNAPGIEEFIKAIHWKVIPKASTNVGLGESTFTIFGTAMKGKSGDLNWDGLEVEVKTNGPSDGGAILGGDKYMNKITDRLEAKMDYLDIAASDLNDLQESLNKVIDEYNSIDTTSREKNNSSAFRVLQSKCVKLFKTTKLTSAIKASNLSSFFNVKIKKDFNPHTSPNRAPDFTLFNALEQKIANERSRIDGKGANLPSQISTFLADDGTLQEYIHVFSELRTYTHTSINFKDQLAKFFSTNNYLQFNPRKNYDAFQRLVGSIAILSYQENIGFDALLVLNDATGSGVLIDCQSNTISSIYNQVSQIPQISFDLNIDVYENGRWKSQTVIAASPRIYMA
jgi:hypothetical protein